MDGLRTTSPAHLRMRLPVRYLLVAWLCVMSAVAYLDRTNISIAGIEICKEFAISKVRLGWIFSVFLIGYAGFQIPAGLLARRLGPRRTLGLLGAWWAVFISVTALIPPGVAHPLLILAGVRFALGAGEAAMYPAASQFVERWFPVQERGKANGIIFAGVGLGGMTPPVVTAVILRYGWRAAFWFSACVGLAAGLVWFVAARDTPEEHDAVSEGERRLVMEGRTAGPRLPDSEGNRRHRVPWAEIFRSKGILAMTASYFCYGYVAWIFFAWFYIYLATVRGLNLKSSAFYSVFPFVAMTVGCLVGGVVNDKICATYGLLRGRCTLPLITFTATAALVLFGSKAHDAATAALMLACGAGVLYLAQSNFWAASADIGGEYTSVVAAMVNMGGQIGGACTASLSPWIAARFGWEASFAVAGTLALLGGLAWLAVDPNRRLEI